MKKVLSLMLAAIMVFSAMAVNVSAATTSTVGGITVTTGDDGSKSYLFNMATGNKDVSGMPKNKSNILGIGDWQFTSGGNTYDLGTLSLSTLLGKEYIDYNFKAQTGIANGTTASTSGNYIRVVTNEIAGANGASSNKFNIIGNVGTDDNPGYSSYLTSDALYRRTFYAYSKTNSSDELTLAVCVMNDSSGALQYSLKPSQLYSANGVPHKVDMFVYATTISSVDYYYMEIYIDGVPVAYTRQKTGAYTKNKMRFRDYMQPIKGLTAYDANEPNNGYIPANGWVIQYVGNEGSGTIDVDKVQRSTLATEFFVQPLAATAAKLNSIARTDDIITGVKSDIDDKLVAELTKTTLGDRTITLSGSYSTVADLYDDKASSNVIALLKTDGTEADDTASLSDVILQVNGVYVSVEKQGAVESSYKPFTVSASDNGKVITRIRRNDYTSTEAPETLGGLDTGFVQLASEPRGSFTIDKGSVMYNRSGYYGLGMYYSTKGSSLNDGAKDSYSNSRYLTLEWDMYMPSYTPESGDIAKLGVAVGSSSSSRSDMPGICFITSAADSTYVPGNNGYVVLTPNAWSRVKVEYDFTDAADNGNVTAKVWVNGTEQTTAETKISGNEAVKTMMASSMQRLDFARLYPKTYTTLAVKNGKWIFGQTENSAIETAATDINVTGISGVSASNDENKLVWEDSSNVYNEDALISSMNDKGYQPVYNYVYAGSAEMSGAYDKTDTYVNSNGVFSGTVVNKWVAASGITSSTTGVTSLTQDEDGNYSVSVDSTFTNNTVYDGVCTPLSEIIAENPELRTKTLAGFAVFEDGKDYPRIYTLTKAKTEFKSVVALADGTARLYYDRSNDASVSGTLVIAAVDEKGLVLAIDKRNITSADLTEGFDNYIEIESSVKNAARYKAFLFKTDSNLPLTLIPMLLGSASN